MEALLGFYIMTCLWAFGYMFGIAHEEMRQIDKQSQIADPVGTRAELLAVFAFTGVAGCVWPAIVAIVAWDSYRERQSARYCKQDPHET